MVDLVHVETPATGYGAKPSRGAYGLTGWTYARGNARSERNQTRNTRARRSRQRAASRDSRQGGGAGARSRAPSTSGWRDCCVCGRCGKRRPKFILDLLTSRRTLSGGKPADPAVRIQRQNGAQRLTSARFPQCKSKGSGITDNCHYQTSELLIVTAADPGGFDRARDSSAKRRRATHVSIRTLRHRGETNEPCRERVSIHDGLMARCRPPAALEVLKALRRRSTLKIVHED